MPFKCDECEEEVYLLAYLSEYGRRAIGTKDDGEYCQKCFDDKFKGQKDDKNQQER